MSSSTAVATTAATAARAAGRFVKETNGIVVSAGLAQKTAKVRVAKEEWNKKIKKVHLPPGALLPRGFQQSPCTLANLHRGLLAFQKVRALSRPRPERVPPHRGYRLHSIGLEDLKAQAPCRQPDNSPVGPATGRETAPADAGGTGG